MGTGNTRDGATKGRGSGGGWDPIQAHRDSGDTLTAKEQTVTGALQLLNLVTLSADSQAIGTQWIVVIGGVLTRSQHVGRLAVGWFPYSRHIGPQAALQRLKLCTLRNRVRRNSGSSGALN